jgi:hypothetical protein
VSVDFLTNYPHTHRNEGRAPVWGSELTKKVATLQGDSVENARTLNVKFRDPVTGGGGGALPPIEPNPLF